MIGTRVGAKVGAFVGGAVGIGADPISVSNPLASVRRDATSGVYMPATLAQFDTLLAAAGLTGGPFAIGLCQEASGNLATVGGYTFTASGTGVTYQQTVSGWATKGITTADAGTIVFTNTDAGLPNIASESLAVMSLTKFNSAPGTFRDVHGMGTTTKQRLFVKSGPEMQMFADGNGTTLSGVDPTGQVRPFVNQHDITNSVERFITNQEAMACTFTATPTGKSIELFGGANASSDATHVYLVLFRGTAANKSPAQWASLFTTMGL